MPPVFLHLQANFRARALNKIGCTYLHILTDSLLPGGELVGSFSGRHDGEYKQWPRRCRRSLDCSASPRGDGTAPLNKGPSHPEEPNEIAATNAGERNRTKSHQRSTQPSEEHQRAEKRIKRERRKNEPDEIERKKMMRTPASPRTTATATPTRRQRTQSTTPKPPPHHGRQGWLPPGRRQ